MHRQLIREEAAEVDRRMAPLNPHELRQMLTLNMDLLGATMPAERVRPFFNAIMVAIGREPGHVVAQALQDAIAEVTFPSDLAPFVLRRTQRFRDSYEPHVAIMRQLVALAG